ncbi:hypothetical protein QUH12_15180, partial [Klebsiella pneumoniae]|nr:hypothetical protein [Klebsiella pneumoniae]
ENSASMPPTERQAASACEQHLVVCLVVHLMEIWNVQVKPFYPGGIVCVRRIVGVSGSGRCE